MSWKLKSKSMLPHGTVVDETHDDDQSVHESTDDHPVHRATMLAVSDTGSSYHEARLRLATRLEGLARELRRTSGTE